MTAPKQRVARRIVEMVAFRESESFMPFVLARADDGTLWRAYLGTNGEWSGWATLPALPDREEPDDVLDNAR